MIKINLKRLTRCHFSLSLNGEFQRFLKIEDLQDLSMIFEKNLSIDKIEDSMPIRFDYKIKLDLNTERQNNLLYAKNKNKIEFPNHLGRTYKNKKIIASYHDLSSYQFYWLNHPELRPKLYALLSSDLIENPYVDQPEDFVEYNGKRAYHINHGTVHGLRQAQYAKKFIDLVKQKASNKWRRIAEQLTAELLACFDLASFLYRVGRTNEDDWENDTTYGARSAIIFNQIALELGFKKDIVNYINWYCFDYHKKLDSLELKLFDHNTIILLQIITRLSHNVDLIRCTYNIEAEVKLDIKKDLGILIFDFDNSLQDKKTKALHCLSDFQNKSLEEITNSFLNYAAILCTLTGSPVEPEVLRSYANGSIKPIPRIAVSSALNVEETINLLETVTPDVLCEKISVTAFCYQTTIQLRDWLVSDVLSRVNILSREDLNVVIEKLMNSHPSWNQEESDELLNIYLNQKHAHLLKTEKSAEHSYTAAPTENMHKLFASLKSNLQISKDTPNQRLLRKA